MYSVTTFANSANAEKISYKSLRKKSIAFKITQWYNENDEKFFLGCIKFLMWLFDFVLILYFELTGKVKFIYLFWSHRKCKSFIIVNLRSNPLQMNPVALQHYYSNPGIPHNSQFMKHFSYPFECTRDALSDRETISLNYRKISVRSPFVFLRFPNRAFERWFFPTTDPRIALVFLQDGAYTAENRSATTWRSENWTHAPGCSGAARIDVSYRKGKDGKAHWS